MSGLLHWAWLAAAARDIAVSTPNGNPFWQTAIVAVSAALLGSAVGGYASFRANEALEVRRRQARAKIRRKAKVYTPIRSELVGLRAARQAGELFGLWGIVREEPPPVIRRPASLHLWRDLVEDGRSLTAASERIRGDLDEVDRCADEFNEQLLKTRDQFGDRGGALLAEMGEEPRVQNWVEVDMPALMLGQFDDLNVTGAGLPGAEMNVGQRAEFENAWKADPAVGEATARMLKVDVALGEAVERAIEDLEAAMRRIAKKYESESPED